MLSFSTISEQLEVAIDIEGETETEIYFNTDVLTVTAIKVFYKFTNILRINLHLIFRENVLFLSPYLL